MIDVKVTVTNLMDVPEKSQLIPLLTVGKKAATYLLHRIPEGKNAHGGNFGKYAVREYVSTVVPGKVTQHESVMRRRVRAQDGAVSRRGHKRPPLRWIPPDLPQPQRNRIAKYRGWSGYMSYGAWKEALGRDTRNFVMTGAMIAGMVVKGLSPTRVRVTFAGQHPVTWKMRDKISNLKLAKTLFRRESVDPMLLSKREAAELIRFVEETLPAQYLNVARANELAFRAKRGLRIAQRKLKEQKAIWSQSKSAAKWSKP